MIQSKASNYRLVSLTCLASKLMESCVRDAMLKHLLENILNTPDQHSFIKGRFFRNIEKLTEDVDQEHSVVIFLDFQKAFDKVPKKRLQKLSAYGIQGKYLDWIADFLSDRKILITVRSAYSEWFMSTAGFPKDQYWDLFCF